MIFQKVNPPQPKSFCSYGDLHFLYRRFLLWKLWTRFWARCLPTWGNVLSHLGQGACPTWARCLSVFLKFCCAFLWMWFGNFRAKNNQKNVWLYVACKGVSLMTDLGLWICLDLLITWDYWFVWIWECRGTPFFCAVRPLIFRQKPLFILGIWFSDKNCCLFLTYDF